jgi:Na+/H+ antiporter NhaC
LPYTFFCLLSPLMSILHAAFGWKIKRHEEWIKEEVKSENL